MSENLSRKQENQVLAGLPAVAAHPKPVGGVLPTAGGSGFMVMASVLPTLLRVFVRFRSTVTVYVGI